MNSLKTLLSVLKIIPVCAIIAAIELVLTFTNLVRLTHRQVRFAPERSFFFSLDGIDSASEGCRIVRSSRALLRQWKTIVQIVVLLFECLAMPSPIPSFRLWEIGWVLRRSYTYPALRSVESFFLLEACIMLLVVVNFLSVLFSRVCDFIVSHFVLYYLPYFNSFSFISIYRFRDPSGRTVQLVFLVYSWVMKLKLNHTCHCDVILCCFELECVSYFGPRVSFVNMLLRHLPTFLSSLAKTLVICASSSLFVPRRDLYVF